MPMIIIFILGFIAGILVTLVGLHYLSKLNLDNIQETRESKSPYSDINFLDTKVNKKCG